MVLSPVLAGGSVLDLDGTFVVQLGLVLVLLVILRQLLFKPLIALIDERERCIEGDVKEAKRRQTEAEDQMRRYERELERVREQAARERDRLRGEGRRREQEILAKAREETANYLEQARASMRREADTVRRDLEVEAKGLAGRIASRVLGRDVA